MTNRFYWTDMYPGEPGTPKILNAAETFDVVVGNKTKTIEKDTSGGIFCNGAKMEEGGTGWVFKGCVVSGERSFIGKDCIVADESSLCNVVLQNGSTVTKNSRLICSTIKDSHIVKGHIVESKVTDSVVENSYVYRSEIFSSELFSADCFHDEIKVSILKNVNSHDCFFNAAKIDDSVLIMFSVRDSVLDNVKLEARGNECSCINNSNIHDDVKMLGENIIIDDSVIKGPVQIGSKIEISKSEISAKQPYRIGLSKPWSKVNALFFKAKITSPCDFVFIELGNKYYKVFYKSTENENFCYTISKKDLVEMDFSEFKEKLISSFCVTTGISSIDLDELKNGFSWLGWFLRTENESSIFDPISNRLKEIEKESGLSFERKFFKDISVLSFLSMAELSAKIVMLHYKEIHDKINSKAIRYIPYRGTLESVEKTVKGISAISPKINIETKTISYPNMLILNKHSYDILKNKYKGRNKKKLIKALEKIDLYLV